MSSFHIGFEQEAMTIGFERTQLCHPFGRLPILNLRVMQDQPSLTGADRLSIQHYRMGNRTNI